MNIHFLCPRWGSEIIPWKTFLPSVKAAGYVGIEWFPNGENTDPGEVIRLLQQYGLDYAIVMAVVNAPQQPADYTNALQTQLLELCSLGKHGQAPLFVSAQTGREYFTAKQIDECLDVCRKVSEQTGIPVYQETHRNKWSYAAHVVAPVLDTHSDLLLTFDVSHWFCVSESYLEDQSEAVEKAITRTRHIHARVGHTEGPQVWEPVSEEFAAALEAHLKIWDEYIRQRRVAGAAYCTITPEFGPPPYLVFANRTGTPQEEQWRLNVWMKDLLEKRYSIEPHKKPK